MVQRAQPAITLFLCGDVMCGRGIDQVLPHPGDPVLYEPYLRDARGYVEIAEAIHGPIPQPLDYAAVWGATLDELARVRPDGDGIRSFDFFHQPFSGKPGAVPVCQQDHPPQKEENYGNKHHTASSCAPGDT